MQKESYNLLVSGIGQLLEGGRRRALQFVNSIIVQTYWEIGRKIVEFEQNGELRAKYGGSLLHQLSKDLKQKYGKGFSITNLQYMRLLYIHYRKHQTLSGKLGQTLSDQLSWSHYVELLAICNDLERAFYEKQCLQERWGVRDLRRQVDSGLFYRLSASKKHGGLLQLSEKGQVITNPQDIVKDPYVLEFLNLPDSYSEKQLEDRIIGNLQMFLLELGKGFSFVARQFRMEMGRTQFYADLVFYNKNLHCYVLLDLKTGKACHSDIGQMNLYLNYFKRHVNQPGDNVPIGIILSGKNNCIEVKYALGGLDNKIFASKYMLSLPSVEELKKAVGYSRY